MKNKGFTLIELLATIIIISIVAIITTSIVFNVIITTKKDSFLLSCKQIYDLYEEYEIGEDIIIGKDECIVFDFASNREKTEYIDNVIYEPVKKLNLKGQYPSNGMYKICGDTKKLLIDNEELTCIGEANNFEILDGQVEDNDRTSPFLQDIILSSTTNSIKVVVYAKEEEGLLAKYHYKIDGQEAVSENGVYTFRNLNEDTEYEIKVVVENKSGLLSEELSKKITTQKVSAATFKVTNNPENTEYSVSKNVQILYDQKDGLKYYFKSTAKAIVGTGIIKSSCEMGTEPVNCKEISTTEIIPNMWYESISKIPSIVYTEEGDLYTSTSDEVNEPARSLYNIKKIDTTSPNIIISSEGIKTDRVTIKAVCEDKESGITKYEYSKDNGITWKNNGTNSSYTFTKLKKDTEYSFKARCTNGSGLTESTSLKNSTLGINDPSIKETSASIKEGYEYATKRVIQIKYNDINIKYPEYYFKTSVAATVESGTVIQACGKETIPTDCIESNVTTLEANTWYKTTIAAPSVTYKKNGALYALISDGTNISGTSVYEISKIDASSPSASISVNNIKTDRATLTASCADSISGITKYEYSSDNGSTWINRGTEKTYTFVGLSKQTEYKFKIRCTNGSGLSKTSTSTNDTLGMTNPMMTQASEQITSGYTWATERTIQITYIGTNITSPQYYFKSSVKTTVPSGTVNASCGNGTNPEECTVSSVTTLEANIWYKTSSANVNVTFTSNGELYALTSDGTNISGTSNYTVRKTSNGTPSAPTITGGNTSWSNSSKTISVTKESTETSGIAKYQYYISTSSTSRTGGSWKDCSTSSKSQTISTNGTKYIFFRAVGNNGKGGKVSSAQTTMIDTSKPTITNIKNGSNSNWTNSNVVITFTANDTGGSTISKTVYSYDKKSELTDFDTAATATSVKGTWSANRNQEVFVKTYDVAGNASGWYSVGYVRIDKSVPGTPTIKYNGGSNTCNWKNNYNLTLTATDNVSIAHYEIDWDSDGVANTTTGSNFIPSNGFSSCTVRFRAVDHVGNKGAWTAVQHIHMDTGAPGTSTIKYNGGSNSCSWKNNYNLTLSSSDNVGIAHYEIDWDSDGVANTTTGSSFVPWDGFSSCTTRFRAVDHAGNKGAWTAVQHIHMDTSAPGTPSITYNSGSNSCVWQNNYNLTLSSSDNVGIAYYQIDYDNNGSADATTGANYIPGNGIHYHYVRFRGVDHAGNVGAWTGTQHIHMDTGSPVHTEWWWGEVNPSVARLYIRTTDNIGIARVQCPTSTQSGGYGNWHWFNAVWDSSANAYRCDITPSTFGHYNQAYQTHLYIYDHAGNGGYYNQTTASIASACSSTRYEDTNGTWGSCSKTCGGGTKNYTVTRTHYSTYTGEVCSQQTGVVTNSTTCNTQACGPLTVFQKADYASEPTIHNTSYVTITNPLPGKPSALGAYIWYRTGEDSHSGSYNINLGTYKKAVIQFEIYYNNCDLFWQNTREATTTINGTKYSCYDNWSEPITSLTLTVTSNTTIPIISTARNDDHNGTWTEVVVFPKSILLYP